MPSAGFEAGTHFTERSSRLLAGDSGRMGNTMRFGHTSNPVRVSLRKGSSQSLTRLADAPPPRALPKLRLKWMRGGLLQNPEGSEKGFENPMRKSVKVCGPSIKV